MAAKPFADRSIPLSEVVFESLSLEILESWQIQEANSYTNFWVALLFWNKALWFAFASLLTSHDSFTVFYFSVATLYLLQSWCDSSFVICNRRGFRRLRYWGIFRVASFYKNIFIKKFFKWAIPVLFFIYFRLFKQTL